MKTLKQLAGLALALSAATFSASAQSPKPEPGKGPPKHERVEVRLENRDELLDSPLGLAQVIAGDSENNFRRFIATGQGDAVEQPLVISTGSLDDGDVANLEEDLAIMARILEKSINRTGGGGENESERKAMGIHLWTLGQGGRGARNLYIDGHGAIFMLAANMPLIGQPKLASDEKEKKDPTNSAWESARNEIYGENDGEPRKRRTERQGPQFDPARLDSLKKNLTESLKNAANIRGLKDNETVTIVVQGPGGRAYAIASGNVRVQRNPGNIPNNHDVFAFSNGEPRRAGPKTLLTLRAKKSDIDDFSKGKIDGEQFRKKVTVSNYQSGGEGARLKQ